MKFVVPLLVALAAQAAHAANSPAEAFALAAADAALLAEKDRRYVRYLLDRPRPGKQAAARFHKLLEVGANGLSREAFFGRALPVGDSSPALFRIDLRDYGWPAEVWEKLADIDPYFHAKIVTRKVETYTEDERWEGGVDKRDGKYYPPGSYKVEKTRVVNVLEENSLHVPGDPKSAAALSALLNSKAPLLRADWFWVTVSRNIDRNNNANTGAGYYDFLGVRNEQDFFDLTGVDRDKAVRAHKEIRAIIRRSGVNVSGSRQVERLAEGVWFSLDSDTPTRGGNALRQLNGDFDFRAKEGYFRLPNGLWAYAALDNKGNLQKSVPDSIASDKESTDNDHRIHPSLSCVRCHLEGLRPLEDWARKTYRLRPPTEPRFVLGSKSDPKLKRLQQLYLTPMLTTWYDADQLVYARALQALAGWTPAITARAYREEWEHYNGDVSGEQFAAELGTTRAELKKALAGAVRAKGYIDPVLAGYLDEPEEPAARVHLEEVFPQAALLITGKSD